uniref:Uncharacterized protein isoform X3 n=1 Tax=Nicotiana tabacum TaxID=4097 RepID=A0A1S4DI81_TOBAC|nr:PREDICTED: uncharacterized protein LOC107830014 isoform X3 [Nicotiana tabacum]XP_033509288.1 uncharacterized protein LOC104086105 isoform X3 [Nicotiana tomentosiformis]
MMRILRRWNAGFSSGLIIPEKYPEETTTRRQSYNLRSVLDPNDLMISRAKKNLRGQILRSMMMMRRRRIVGSQGFLGLMEGGG